LDGFLWQKFRATPVKIALQNRFIAQKKSPMPVNIQIDAETAEKLLLIQQQTDRDRTEILQVAVADYYNKLIQTSQARSEFLESNSQLDDWSDFIGSIEAESDLSTNYKTYLKNELDQKYVNR
jgi:hypothetical protein